MAARWSPTEDALLAELYKQDVRLHEIAQRLGRSPDAVGARRAALGITARRAPREWSSAQDMLIRASASAGVPSAALSRQLKIPVGALRARRTTLLGRRTAAPRYDAAEDDAIRNCWANTGDWRELASELGRSIEGVRLRASALGLGQRIPRARWTAAEDHALRNGYTRGLSCRDIQRQSLITRTPQTISARAHRLGLTSYARRWTDREDRQLVALARAGTPLERCALTLTRTPEAIRQRARRLDIDTPRPVEHPRARKRWSAAHDALLRDHPGAHPSVLAITLGRSDRAVSARMATLGLRAERARSPHHALAEAGAFSPAEHRLLRRELASSPGARRLLALARRLERSPGELKRRVSAAQGELLAS